MKFSPFRFRAPLSPMMATVVIAVAITIAFSLVAFIPLLWFAIHEANPLFRLAQDHRLWKTAIRTFSLSATIVTSEAIVALIAIRIVPSLSLCVKALLVLPALISPATAAIITFLFVSPAIGPLSSGLVSLGIRPPLWLGAPKWMFTLIVLIEMWQWTPLLVVLCVHATEIIAPTHLEQARLEGASNTRIWWSIRLPAAMPVLVVFTLIRLFDTLRLFDGPFVLFGSSGGPANGGETISILLYRLYFQAGQRPYASFVSLILLVACSVVLFAATNLHAVSRALPWRRICED